MIAIKQSPFYIFNLLDANNQVLTEKDFEFLNKRCMFNSFEAFSSSFTNLSVMMILKNEYELAKLCCMRSLKLCPDNQEANINMNNIMRRIGQK